MLDWRSLKAHNDPGFFVPSAGNKRGSKWEENLFFHRIAHSVLHAVMRYLKGQVINGDDAVTGRKDYCHIQ